MDECFSTPSSPKKKSEEKYVSRKSEIGRIPVKRGIRLWSSGREPLKRG